MPTRLQPLQHQGLLLDSWIYSIGVVHGKHSPILALDINHDKTFPMINRVGSLTEGARSDPDSYPSDKERGFPSTKLNNIDTYVGINCMQIDHVHFYTRDAVQTSNWLSRNIGFQAIAKNINSHTYSQVVANNSVFLLISSALKPFSPVSRYLNFHPSGVADIAFRVPNIRIDFG